MASDNIGEKWRAQWGDGALGYIGFGDYIHLKSKEGYIEVYYSFRRGRPGAPWTRVEFQYRTKKNI